MKDTDQMITWQPNHTHRLNRHTRTMKREREQRVLSPIPLELRPEHRLRQTECVSQVQMSVAVRIRECHDELLVLRAGLRIVRRIGFEGLLAFPHRLDGEFGSAEGIAFREALWCVPLEGEVGHLGGGGGGGWGHCWAFWGGLWLVLTSGYSQVGR